MRWFKNSKAEAKNDLREALLGMELPRFQQGIAETLNAVRDPKSSVKEIVTHLQTNPGLIVETLRTVNSAAFGLRAKVDSLEHAITLLGRSQLELLILGASVRQALPSKPSPGFDSRRFWNSAFARAGLARSLAEKLHPADGPRSFLGGLLQDMVVPLAAHARPKDYGAILTDWQESPRANLSDLEREVMGWTHEELGATLAVAWDLPESIARLIAEHHLDPGEEGGAAPPAVRLVSAYSDSQREFGLEVLIERGRDLFELDPDWVRDAVLEAESEAEKLVRSIGSKNAA